MSNESQEVTTPEKILPVIFVMDVCDDIEGEYITRLQRAIKDFCTIFREVFDQEITAKDIKTGKKSIELDIGGFFYSSGIKEIGDCDRIDGMYTFGRQCDYNLRRLGEERKAGPAVLGNALNELNRIMSRKAFFYRMVGYMPPIVVFMSDKDPVDDYVAALEEIVSTNEWFKISQKLAVEIGQDAHVEAFRKIIDNEESIFNSDHIGDIKGMIKHTLLDHATCTDHIEADIIENYIQNEAAHKKRFWLNTWSRGKVFLNDPFGLDLDLGDGFYPWCKESSVAVVLDAISWTGGKLERISTVCARLAYCAEEILDMAHNTGESAHNAFAAMKQANQDLISAARNYYDALPESERQIYKEKEKDYPQKGLLWED